MAPFHLDAFDEQLRRALKELGVKFEDSEDGIRDIAVVGALLLGSELFPNDMKTLSDVLPRLHQGGIKTHPQCRFWIYNLVIKSDFLAAAQPIPTERAHLYPLKIDLVICSFIFNGRPSKHQDQIAGVSPFHLEQNIWSRSARSLNARIIVTHGGESEVGVHFFTSDGAHVEIPEAHHLRQYSNLQSRDLYAYAVSRTEEQLQRKLRDLPPDPQLQDHLHTWVRLNPGQFPDPAA